MYSIFTVSKLTTSKLTASQLTDSQPMPLPEQGWVVCALDVSVPAGFPSPADDHSARRIDVLEHLVKHPQATFQMRVRGESMREAGIGDGDVVLVDRAITPRSGQIVVAVVDGDFTVKQLKMDSGANKVGEFSLTDRRFSRIDRFMADTLYDENYGGRYGNCHIAVGSSHAETYADKVEKTQEFKKEKGYNDSALHWDLVNTENKTVTAHLATGESLIIYDSGVFKY